MAYKKDNRQKVRILHSDDAYLIGIVGVVISNTDDIYSVLVGPYTLDFNKKDLQFIGL